MAPLLIKLVLAPALVAAATLAERAWGPRVAGVLAAFPAIVGPLLLVTAVERGARATAHAAEGTLVGLVALAAFTVVYAETARHRPWLASLTAGWFAAGLAAGAAAAWAQRVGPITAGAIATLSLAGAGAALIRRGCPGAALIRRGCPLIRRGCPEGHAGAPKATRAPGLSLSVMEKGP